MKIFYLSIVLILFIIITACSNNTSSNQEKNDFEITVSQTFQIGLISNPSTGYSWKWANKESVTIVDTVDIGYISDFPDRVGSSGKEIWKFRGLKAGIDTLKLEYNRAWEENSAIDSKQIIVKVK